MPWPITAETLLTVLPLGNHIRPPAASADNAGTSEQRRYLRDSSARTVADTDAAVASRL